MEIKVMLEKMVGQEASVNSSPTRRAKLIKVLDNGKCMWEVVEGPWRSSDQFFHKIGTKFTMPMWISGNCFWGV
jgi:hypothetical protein